MSVDLNLLNPYDIVESDELDYSFVTKDGIVYRAYFLCASNLHPDLTDVYSFNIEPVGEPSVTKHHIDSRISMTVASILRNFFLRNENSMLMACDCLDGKEQKRRVLFDRWFEIYNDKSIMKIDASLANDDYRLYVSMFISKNNPKREILITAFNELIKTDLYELGF